MPRATLADRVRDAVAIALLVGGGALFLYARRHLQLLASDQITRVPGHSAVEQAEHFDRLSRAGLWTAGAGLVLAVALAVHQHRRASSSSSQS